MYLLFPFTLFPLDTFPELWLCRRAEPLDVFLGYTAPFSGGSYLPTLWSKGLSARRPQLEGD